MEDKYYTPELEEFHVGFEYEATASANVDADDWYKTSITERHQFESLGDYENLRVKYLDREDIEKTIGWTSEGAAVLKEEGLNKHPLEGVQIWKCKTCTVVWNANIPTKISISVQDTGASYNGSCKNLSKLKAILKDLGCNRK